MQFFRSKFREQPSKPLNVRIVPINFDEVVFVVDVFLNSNLPLIELN